MSTMSTAMESLRRARSMKNMNDCRNRPVSDVSRSTKVRTARMQTSVAEVRRQDPRTRAGKLKAQCLKKAIAVHGQPASRTIRRFLSARF